jgi:hypothetical protein
LTSQIAKQNKEIEKITSDIRDLQKTINLNTNTLQRSDAVTDEMIFAVSQFALSTIRLNLSCCSTLCT